MTTDICADDTGDADWCARWKDLGNNSFLKQSQAVHPEKWQVFYDRVSDVWERMAGISPASGKEMARVLAGQGLLGSENFILELGCGPGNFSMALAGYGCRVTAIDLSPGMIRVLENKIQTSGISGIQPLVADWNTLDPTPNHDLVVAAFFPEACNPHGICRMEKLAKQFCVLVLGNGTSAFPLYRQIWTQVMDAPCPISGDHLDCAVKFLRQTGRHPDIHTLVCPAVLDVHFSQAREYFRAYFGMFGCSGSLPDQVIDDVLNSHVKNDRILLEGQSSASMVCWPVPVHSPGQRNAD